uniref:Uncharacterized protein n=1 Tax=Zea mays TaxID=4577 RepID=C4J3U1_MAIZE|nr:unknown [Zea mays]
MVLPEPALADAAEREPVYRVLHYRVVEGDAPGRRLVHDSPPQGGVPGERVDGERLRHGLHEGDAVLDVLDRDDREQGPEYLLGHDRGVQRRVQQYRGLNVQVLAVHGAAVQDGRRHGPVFEKVTQPLEVALVHDPCHVVRFREEPLQRRLEHLDQDGREALLDEHVVDGDAGLSGAGRPLARDHAVNRDLQVPGAAHGVEDAGALAAQLQRDGRQVPGRRGHHGARDAGAPGEEDLVPAVLHELHSDVGAALDDLHRRGVHVPPDVVAQEPGGARRELGRLQSHRVPGRYRPDQRLQRQAQGDVPAGEDEDDPERLRHHLRGRRPSDQRDPHLRSPTQRRQRATVAEEETITGLLEHYVPVACLLRGHPFAELLQRAVGGLDEHPDLAKPEKTQPNRPERPRQCRSIHQTEAKANKEKENGDGVHGLLATGRDLVPVRLGVVLAEVLVERLERLHLLLLEEPEEAPQLRLPPR